MISRKFTKGTKAKTSGNITAGHVRAFHAISSQLYDNITLWSCTINGEPGVAIVMVDQVAEDKVAVMPLFVAITSGMEIDFDGEGEGSGSSTRTPSRYDVLRQMDPSAPEVA